MKTAAELAGIPVLQPEDVNHEEEVEAVRRAEPDVLLVVAYGKILKSPILEVPRLLPLNLHFSLLPEFRGAAPVAHAIARGCTQTGVTVQRIVRKLDAGPILDAERCAIRPEETAGELMDRLTAIGARLTVETLDRLRRGTWEETPQDHDRATLAPMLSKADGWVDWRRGAEEVHCHVRAMDPWPGAFSRYLGRSRREPVRVTLLRCRVEEESGVGGAPGEVVGVARDGILVQAGRGRVAVTLLKPAGKRALTAAEFRNGYGAAPGDRFCGE